MNEKEINKEEEKSNIGSIQNQIENLTSSIKNLSLHLKKHRKDFSSKRAIYKLSKKNKKFKSYLKK